MQERTAFRLSGGPVINCCMRLRESIANKPNSLSDVMLNNIDNICTLFYTPTKEWIWIKTNFYTSGWCIEMRAWCMSYVRYWLLITQGYLFGLVCLPSSLYYLPCILFHNANNQFIRRTTRLFIFDFAISAQRKRENEYASIVPYEFASFRISSNVTKMSITM